MWSSRSSLRVLQEEEQQEEVQEEEKSWRDKHLHQDHEGQQQLPVGARVVDTSSVGKESQHDAPQDDIRVSCKKKPPSDS